MYRHHIAPNSLSLTTMKPELEASGGAESSLGFILFLEGGFDTYIIFIPHSSEYSLSHTHTILKCLYARKLFTGLSNFTLKIFLLSISSNNIQLFK